MRETRSPSEVSLPRFLHRPALCAGLALVAAGLESGRAGGTPSDPAPTLYGFRVVATWPHDRSAFTEGLVWLPDGLLESTGINGESEVRKVDLASGRVTARVRLPYQYFGEGAAVIGGKVYQLTWQSQRGFVYDLATLKQEREFTYAGEGWGLATDGTSLILSNGTNQIQVMDPQTFRVTRVVSVTLRGQPLARLNELEVVRGELYANVWQTDWIVRIDLQSGKVVGIVDFSGLLPPEDYDQHTDVLNGIAYDPAGDRLFVTGKRWPKLFEVVLVEKAK